MTTIEVTDEVAALWDEMTKASAELAEARYSLEVARSRVIRAEEEERAARGERDRAREVYQAQWSLLLDAMGR